MPKCMGRALHHLSFRRCFAVPFRLVGALCQALSSSSPGPRPAGPGVFGEIEDLADDQVLGVVDDVAVQFQDLVGPARASPRVSRAMVRRVSYCRTL